MPLLPIIVPVTGRFGQDRLVWLVGPLMCGMLATVIARRIAAEYRSSRQAVTWAGVPAQPADRIAGQQG